MRWAKAILLTPTKWHIIWLEEDEGEFYRTECNERIRAGTSMVRDQPKAGERTCHKCRKRAQV